METLTLIRHGMSPDFPTTGMIVIDGGAAIGALELPWLDNKQDISCIPLGTYTCKRTIDRKMHSGKVIPVTYEVTGVPDRSGILFHRGNTTQDTRGCILVGMQIKLSSTVWLDQSRKAMNLLLTGIEEDSFKLKIICPIKVKE